MDNKIELVIVKRTHPQLLDEMARHYSKPKGFVGRNICYSVLYNGHCYGHIVGGSATKHLPLRDEFLGKSSQDILNCIVNNIFYHVEPIDGKYPIRNFTTEVIKAFETQIVKDWESKYGDAVVALETLVELPRTGECYKKAKWIEISQTKGYTCKRVGGKGSEKWSGTRVWDRVNLRPKRVFMKLV